MSWMVKWPGAFPVFVAEASGAHFRDVDGHRLRRLLPRRHRRDDRALARRRPSATVREQVGRGITAMLPTEDSVVVAEELAPPVRAAAVAVHPVGHRRQPARDPLRPARHRPAARSSCTTTATTAASTRPSRRWTPTGAPSPGGATSAPPVDPAETTLGGRVQRRRRPGAGAGQRRGGRGARRAGADQRRHRAARARLPRRAARADPAARRAAGHRRDAHAVAPGPVATPARTASSRTS